ncbi:MAG: hypothetical protein KDK62_08635, partial [Chlamydiia bacterium]|nr:hypothetical protein [Chlamydiia bacterium]
FAMHSYRLTDRSFYVYRMYKKGVEKGQKGIGKEKLLTALDMTRLTGALLEDGAMLVVGMKTLGLVGAKVAATASIIGFAGMAIQTVSIAIDTYRIVQSVKEYISLRNGDLDTGWHRRISFQALYGLHRHGKWKDSARTKWRPGITDKKVSEELISHLKKRLRWGIAFRAMAIVAASVGIVALGILLFAPTPAAPVGWALVGTAVAVSIVAIAAKVFIRWRQDKEFKKLEDNYWVPLNGTHEAAVDSTARLGLLQKSAI